MEINESLKQFLAKLAQDEELQAKMEAATSPEEAYAIASAVQSGFSKEEFVQVMSAIKNQNTEELSDDDLEKVAGGKADWRTHFSLDKYSHSRTVTEPVNISSAKALM